MIGVYNVQLVNFIHNMKDIYYILIADEGDGLLHSIVKGKKGIKAFLREYMEDENDIEFVTNILIKEKYYNPFNYNVLGLSSIFGLELIEATMYK